MSMQAGFSEVDISPSSFPARTYWAPVDTMLDPIRAQAAVFGDGQNLIAFLSLNVVIVEREYVERIREGAAALCPVPPQNIMVCATHNHACPAVVNRPWSAKDDAYLDAMVEKGSQAIATAWKAMVPAETGTGTGYEGRIAFNRRFVLKNGTVISQPSPEILENDVRYAEAIIDPEVGVLAARDANGTLTGALVNFACHAVHLMGSLSGGYPAVLCEKLKQQYGPGFVCVFLNGPCGNVHHRNHSIPGQDDTKERFGAILAEDVIRIMRRIRFSSGHRVNACSTSIDLRYRDIKAFEEAMDELPRYNVFQVLIDNGWYRWSLERLKEMHARQEGESAEIQLLQVGQTVFGGIPAEYFSQYALFIKENSSRPRTFVVSLANGWVGYIPDRPAFDRIGGHESTWCFSSRMEPEAGNRMASQLVDMIRHGSDS